MQTGQAKPSCFVSTPAQVCTHLHNVVTIFHLERDVLHSIPVFHQVVAHLCGQLGGGGGTGVTDPTCTSGLLGSVSF